jgi:hypothetical protein
VTGLLMLYQFLVDCPEQLPDQSPILCNQVVFLGYRLIASLQQLIVGVPYATFFPQMMTVPLDQQIKYFPDNDGIPVPGRKHGIPGLPSLIQYFLNNLQNLGFVKQ